MSEQPGWIHQNDTQCHFSYGGQDYAASNYDFWIPSWVPVTQSANLPLNAIPFGFEPSPQPSFTGLARSPCRTQFSGTITTGKYGPDLGGCLFPYGGTEQHQVGNGFDVLTDPDGNPGFFVGTPGTLIGPFVATPVASTPFPYNAIVGGVDSDGATLYLCSAEYPAGTGREHPGKTKASMRACSVSFGGSEQFIASYLVLTPDWIPETGSNFNCKQGSSPCTVTRPILAGNDTDGQPLYLCRGSIDANGAVYPGKIGHSFAGGCSMSVNGQDITPPPMTF